MAETVLITGGAGFIGCHVGRELLRRGNKVIALDSLIQQVHGSGGRPGVRRLPGGVQPPAGLVQRGCRLRDVARLSVGLHLSRQRGEHPLLRRHDVHGGR